MVGNHGVQEVIRVCLENLKIMAENYGRTEATHTSFSKSRVKIDLKCVAAVAHCVTKHRRSVCLV